MDEVKTVCLLGHDVCFDDDDFKTWVKVSRQAIVSLGKTSRKSFETTVYSQCKHKLIYLS